MEKKFLLKKSSDVGQSHYEQKAFLMSNVVVYQTVYTGKRKHKNKAKYSNLYTRWVPTNGMLNTNMS